MKTELQDLPDELELDCFKSIAGRINGFMVRCINDADYTCIFMSTGTAEMLGYPASDFIGNRVRALSSIMVEEDQVEVGAKVEQALARQVPWEVEYRLKRSDGSVIWVHDQGAGVFNKNGELEYLEGFVFSVDTQRKAQVKEQERQRKLASETTFILSLVDDIMRTLKTLSIISLNARVEAGRAGDAGRGFAVIATQVGRLADETGKLARGVEQHGVSVRTLLK